MQQPLKKQSGTDIDAGTKIKKLAPCANRVRAKRQNHHIPHGAI